MSINFKDNYKQFNLAKTNLEKLNCLIKSIDHMYIPSDDFSDINEKLEKAIEDIEDSKKNILKKTNRIQTDVLTEKDLEKAKVNKEDYVQMVGKTWTRWSGTKNITRGRDSFTYVYANTDKMELFKDAYERRCGSAVCENYYENDHLRCYGIKLTGKSQENAVFDEYVISELGLYIDTTTNKKIKVGRFSDLVKDKKEKQKHKSTIF
jgi:hypothetical protein